MTTPPNGRFVEGPVDIYPVDDFTDACMRIAFSRVLDQLDQERLERERARDRQAFQRIVEEYKK